MYQDKNSLEIFFKSYLEREGSSIKTQKNYVTDLRDFFSFLEGTGISRNSEISASVLSTVTPKEIELYRHYLSGLQKSDATIQRRLSSLRTFFRACENARLINHYPFPTEKNIDSISHPLVHVWHGHLKEKGLPIRMSADVNEFLFWIHDKKKH